MKKIYSLLSVFALVSSGALAQSSIKADFATESKETTAKPTQTHTKGATLWLNNFDNPSDWVAEADDSTHGWSITPTGGSWFQADPINSTSGGNYALFQNGRPTPPVTTVKGKEWNITTATSIDLSADSSVSLSYQIYGARFVDDLEFQYSLDNITWLVADKLSSNVRTLSQTQSENDIPNVTTRSALMPGAGGQPTVWLRIQWINNAIGTGNDGIAYGYKIDDIAIIEAPNKDLAITETYPGGFDDSQNFLYQEIPLEQAHTLYPAAIVANNGGVAQNVTLTVEFIHNGNVIGTYSKTDSIEPAATKTISLTTFKPTLLGEYTMKFSVTGSSADTENSPVDNLRDDKVIMTNDTYSDDVNGVEWTGSFYNPFRPSGQTTGPYSLIAGGQAFQVFNPGSKAYGLTTVFVNGTVETTVDQLLYAELYKIDTADYKSGFTTMQMALVGYREYSIAATDTFSSGSGVIYTRINFDTPADLTPGIYVASIQVLGGSSAYNLPVYSDENRDVSGSLRGNIQSGTSEGSYTFFSNLSPFIKLNLGQTIGIKETKTSNFELGQNQPNPFNGTSNVVYTLKEAGNVTMTITDITGKTIVSSNLGNKAAGAYNYVINSNDLTAGIYFYSLTVDGSKTTKKMVISE